MSSQGGSGNEGDKNPFETVRGNEDAVKAVAEREDRIGAFARVTLALSDDERPQPSDLEDAGLDQTEPQEEKHR